VCERVGSGGKCCATADLTCSCRHVPPPRSPMPTGGVARTSASPKELGKGDERRTGCWAYTYDHARLHQKRQRTAVQALWPPGRPEHSVVPTGRERRPQRVGGNRPFRPQTRDWVCQGCYMAVTPTVRYPPVSFWRFRCPGTTLCVLRPPYVGECGIWWMQGIVRCATFIGALFSHIFLFCAISRKGQKGDVSATNRVLKRNIRTNPMVSRAPAPRNWSRSSS